MRPTNANVVDTLEIRERLHQGVASIGRGYATMVIPRITPAQSDGSGFPSLPKTQSQSIAKRKFASQRPSSAISGRERPDPSWKPKQLHLTVELIIANPVLLT